ncbi:hypothetical protein D3C76_612280 [compost metagenome]
MEGKAYGNTLRFAWLKSFGLSERCQRFYRLTQFALWSFVIDLNDLFSCIGGSGIFYVYADFNQVVSLFGNQLGLLRLHYKFGIGYTVAKFKLNLVRAKCLKITISLIDIFFIHACEFIAVVAGGWIILDGEGNRIG